MLRLPWWARVAGGVALWALVYHYWLPFIVWLFHDVLSLPDTRWASALEFFVYDSVKVLLLLTLVVFGVGIVRSFFSPQRTRALLRGRRETTGNVMAAGLGIVTPVLQLLGGAAVHRLRRGRHPAGRDLLVPDRRAHGQRDRPGAALRAVRLGGRRPLPRHRPAHRHRRRLGHRPPAHGALHRGLGARDPHGRGRRHGEELDWAGRVSYAWQAVKDIVGKVWPYVLAGIAVGAIIHGYVPENFMASIMGADAWWSVPLAVLLGIPMYSNAAGIIPIVEALLEKGAALGTVLAFMMAVIALSLPETIILQKVLKWQLIAVFLGVVGAGIMSSASCSTRSCERERG